jgi:nucleotide-binding universal stress UspA family protein
MPERVVRRILAPVELVDTSEPDLGYAIGLAAQLQAELRFFAVVDTPTTVALVARHRAPAKGRGDFDKLMQDEVRSILQRLVDAAAARGVRALGHVTFDEEVEEQILKEALVQKVDLILIRSGGRAGLMKALLGSTAGEILKAAPCPVLVARA